MEHSGSSTAITAWISSEAIGRLAASLFIAVALFCSGALAEESELNYIWTLWDIGPDSGSRQQVYVASFDMYHPGPDGGERFSSFRNADRCEAVRKLLAVGPNSYACEPGFWRQLMKN